MKKHIPKVHWLTSHIRIEKQYLLKIRQDSNHATMQTDEQDMHYEKHKQK